MMLYRPFENKLNLVLSEHGMQRAQWTVLYYLYHFGSSTLVELAHYQGVEKPTVTRTMNRLEEMAYVEQVPSKDKREKRMRLTELGKKVYGETRVPIDEFEAKILSGITETEQLEAIRIMEEIRNNIVK